MNVISQEGKYLVESREVAQMIEKDHKHLMRDIRGYINIIDESPSLDYQEFFLESNYVTVQKKLQPCFLLTRKGCDMVANKMQGSKGVLFTAQYVTAFEAYANQTPSKLSPLEQLKL